MTDRPLTSSDIVVNGRAPHADDLASIMRGVAFGDGVLTTLRVCRGVIELWPQHYRRLRRAARALKLPLPAETTLLSDMATLLGGRREGVVRIVLTRSDGATYRGGYRADGQTVTTVRIIQWRQPQPLPPTCRLCHSPITIGDGNSDWKYSNRLPQVLAAQALPPACDEAVICDSDGNVVCAIAANIVYSDGQSLFTPPLTGKAAVRGVMRAALRRCAAQHNLSFVFRRTSVATLRAAQAIWLTNSVVGMRQVSSYQGGSLDDAVATRLHAQLHPLLSACCQRYGQPL